jgi:hypothetical protein
MDSGATDPAVENLGIEFVDRNSMRQLGAEL